MNDEISKALAFCSGPFWPDKAHVQVTIVTELIKLVLREIISALPKTDRDVSGLEFVLSELHKVTGLHNIAWTPSIGQGHRAALSPETQDPVAAAINLVLNFIEDLPSVSFSCELKEPQRLMVYPFILPKTQRLTITWVSPILQVTTPSFTVNMSITADTRELTSFLSELEESIFQMINIGPFDIPTHETAGIFNPLDSHSTDIVSVNGLPTTIKAIELLNDYTPEYFKWITPMTHYLIPTIAPSAGFASGSDRFNPGAISVSFPIDVVLLTESLVHETSHQYFFLVNGISDLVDSTHKQLYYSPFTGTPRPLERILLAYHAAANILCFYQLLISRDAPYKPSPSSLNSIKDSYTQLAGHLYANKALTGFGQSLFKPIYNLILDKQWAITRI